LPLGALSSKIIDVSMPEGKQTGNARYKMQDAEMQNMEIKRDRNHGYVVLLYYIRLIFNNAYQGFGHQ